METLYHIFHAKATVFLKHKLIFSENFIIIFLYGTWHCPKPYSGGVLKKHPENRKNYERRKTKFFSEIRLHCSTFLPAENAVFGFFFSRKNRDLEQHPIKHKIYHMMHFLYLQLLLPNIALPGLISVEPYSIASR